MSHTQPDQKQPSPLKVALGVTGGIAAYKAAELVRELQQHGLEVQVILTANGQEFVRPLTFAALTGRKVITRMFGSADQEERGERHRAHRGRAVDRSVAGRAGDRRLPGQVRAWRCR